MSMNSARIIITASLARVLAAGMLLLASFGSHAQLPELASPSSTSGPTTARFFGGASADSGVSYKSSFGFSEAIDVSAEIRVETAHRNTVGNLYLIIGMGNQYFVRNQSGAYVPWDLTLPKLLPASPAKTLQANEPLTIVSKVAFGPAGVSDVSLSVFLAYDTTAVPGKLFYSGVPLTFAIGKQVSTPASLTLFTNNVHSQIIQSNCIACHSNFGIASATSSTPSQLQYVGSSTANSLTTNYTTLVNYIKSGGSSALLSKPRGIGHLGGVQMTANSQTFLNLQAFVNAVLAE